MKDATHVESIGDNITVYCDATGVSLTTPGRTMGIYMSRATLANFIALLARVESESPKSILKDTGLKVV
jgi:hypothetical protein